jgi:hypothetical protein
VSRLVRVLLASMALAAIPAASRAEQTCRHDMKEALAWGDSADEIAFVVIDRTDPDLDHPCLDRRVGRVIYAHLLDDAHASPGWYGSFYDFARSVGMRKLWRASALRCRGAKEPVWGAYSPARSEPLAGSCAIPSAWAKRGLKKSELLLDVHIYALLLEVWTTAEDRALEEPFVKLVRYLSAEAPKHCSASACDP